MDKLTQAKRDAYYIASAEYRKALINDIMAILKNHQNKIVWKGNQSCIDELEDNCWLFCYYDGGHHSEYEQGDSYIYGIKANDRDFSLMIEETDDYGQDRLSLDDVENVLEILDSYKTWEKNNKK